VPPPARPPQTAKAAGTNSVATNSPSPSVVTNPSTALAANPAGTNSNPTNTLATAPPAAGSNQAPKVGPLGSLGHTTKSPPKPGAGKRRDDWIDIAWSLINSDEFLYRH